MKEQFPFDVFLSHSSKDKAVVRAVADRLRSDGLKVWFDEWVLKTGDSISEKIEGGLEHSRVLLLCMSANAFGSDWAQLEAGTFRFRDPLNKERRFIPLRLDDAPINGSLVQFLYINWVSGQRDLEYAKLLEACRPPEEAQAAKEHVVRKAAESIDLKTKGIVWAYSLSPDGEHALTVESTVLSRWNVSTGLCLRSRDDEYWDAGTTIDANGRHVVSGSDDAHVRLWDIETGQCVRVFEGHTGRVTTVALGAEGRHAISGSDDMTVRLWDIDTGRCVRVFEGHTNSITTIALSGDEHLALSSCQDRIMRFWELSTGLCVRVIEGHKHQITSTAINANTRYALSGSKDTYVRLWDLETGLCLCALGGHRGIIQSVAWSTNQRRAISGDHLGGIRVWDLSEFVIELSTPQMLDPSLSSHPDHVQYTNAKVLLVGESAVGKTGLSKRLASNDWQPSDSTVGAWATQWKMDLASDDTVEREIWLWDFGGQADQRLIHQLYMDDTALAVLVFDGQKEDLFETLGQWDRDLTRSSRKEFAKLLVAGRVDAGGLRVSHVQVKAFAEGHGYSRYLETSAKLGTGCEELRQAILDGIRWERIPWRTSPRLFKRLKEEIIRLKEEGRGLMRFNELRETLQMRLTSESKRFSDEELKAVIGLLAGPGAVWELKFGSWVLLQPEGINAYAQAVIQTLRDDVFERGCIPEEQVLAGDLKYQSSAPRLPEDEERIVLLAMHQALVERALCLREHTETGTMLIFPSYYRRERKELTGHPAVQVSYRFHGFLDDIYATLVVRLHHARTIEKDKLWRYAADFRTLTGKQLGVKLTRVGEGAGELDVYFDPTIPIEEKILFSKYVHEHVMRKGQDVVRLRHYVCPHCGTQAGNRDVAMKRLNDWLERRPAEVSRANRLPEGGLIGDVPTMICVACEKRFPLWDGMEEYFASPEAQQRVRELQEQFEIILDNESKGRVLVGEVISTVALAGQICRELTVSDHGIDMEIEFKNDTGEATGRRVYLQLKSGDSYLRRSRGSEIFTITKERHAKYWLEQEVPVLLVIRSSGKVRWMEIRDYLKRESDGGRKVVKDIVFKGERFDVMSVRRWRDRVLSGRVS